MNKNKDSKYVIANKLAKFLYIYVYNFSWTNLRKSWLI